MSVLRLKCCCGGELEIRAFLVREMNVDCWLAAHSKCPEAVTSPVSGLGPCPATQEEKR